MYFIALALIGRYIISPYFSAVFLEAYLSASFKDSISLDPSETSEPLGKPVRKHLKYPKECYKNVFINSSFLLDLICTLKPTPSELVVHVAWLSENNSSKMIQVKVFDRFLGWKNNCMIVKGDALFLCKESKKQSWKLSSFAILPSAKILVTRSSTLIEEVIPELCL